MRKVLFASVMLAFVLTGCNTFKGMGEDVSKVGEKVTETAEKTQDKIINIPVQVNGKVRGTIEVDVDATKEIVIQKAKDDENIHKFLEGKTIIKEIFIPGKIFNMGSRQNSIQNKQKLITGKIFLSFIIKVI